MGFQEGGERHLSHLLRQVLISGRLFVPTVTQIGESEGLELRAGSHVASSGSSRSNVARLSVPNRPYLLP